MPLSMRFRLKMKLGKCEYIAFGAMSFTFLCAMQTYFWPVVVKPSTVFEWWQVRWMAEVGALLAAPAFVVWWYFKLNFWVSALLWTVAIFVGLREACIRLTRNSTRTR